MVINMLLYVVIIPLAVIAAGLVVNYRWHMHGNIAFLITAAVLFSVSIFLPSPIIHGIDTEFWTHVFGGGMFIGLLCLYFRPLIKRDLKWYEELVLLFVLVCAFGVINELYELFSQQVGISDESLEDTSWDLLANTVGAVTFFVLYKGINRFKTLFISR